MSLTLIALALLQSQPAAATELPAKAQKICRDSEKLMGSRVRTGRRCMTQEQWSQEDARRVRRPVTMQVTGDQGDGNKAPVQPH